MRSAVALGGLSCVGIQRAASGLRFIFFFVHPCVGGCQKLCTLVLLQKKTRKPRIASFYSRISRTHRGGLMALPEEEYTTSSSVLVALWSNALFCMPHRATSRATGDAMSTPMSWNLQGGV
jgi:hypothetical protein